MSQHRPTFEDVVRIMARLRGKDGCPWDRQQTHRSLSPYLLEEAYEALDAIDTGEPARLREELGDLLLQVVFHAQMAAEAVEFTIDDVVAGLGEKLIRRHPHVFGDAQASGPEDVLTHWEEIKEAERAGAPETGALDGLPRTLPALMLAQQMQARAARVGFAWPGFREALSKVREELTELERAADDGAQDRIAEEMGDVLFTLANLSRYAGVESEQVLRAACAKFHDRFARLEAAARAQGRSLRDCSAEELLTLWRAAR